MAYTKRHVEVFFIRKCTLSTLFHEGHSNKRGVSSCLSRAVLFKPLRRCLVEATKPLLSLQRFNVVCKRSHHVLHMQRAFFHWLFSLMVKLTFYEGKDHGSNPCRAKDTDNGNDASCTARIGHVVVVSTSQRRSGQYEATIRRRSDFR